MAAVGHRRHEHRHGDTLRVELAERICEIVEEAHVRRQRARRRSASPRARRRRPRSRRPPRACLPARIPAAARPSSSTTISLGKTFTADAAVDDRRVDGVAQRRLVAAAPASPSCASAASVVAGSSSARSATLSGPGSASAIGSNICRATVGDMDRRPLAVERLEHPAEPGHGAAAHRSRRVAARASQGRAQLAHLLLGHLDRITRECHRREA